MRKPLLTFLAAAVMAAPVFAADAPKDGLAAKHSRYFDEVRTAAAFPATYRQVHIPPIEVVFRKGWPKDANKIQSPSRHITQEDVQRITQEMAQTLRGSLTRDLQAAGYEVVGAPGPGVLVLKTAIEDVQVNAPDNATYARTNTFVREAGEASLHIDAYDGASSARVMTISDRGKARSHMLGVDRANTASNRFWFDEMFDRWSDAVAKELTALKAG
jgi:hypothetical protein